MVVLLGRDRLPRRRGHGSRFGVPPVRVPGREHGEGARARCPGLRSPKHGSWYFSVDLPSAAGQRRRLRRDGFATRAAAVAVLETLASPAVSLVPYLGGIPLAQLTVGDVQAMFTAIVRAALNGAVRSGLITVNPGRFPELPRPPGRGRQCGLRR